jgi:RNA polymerase sigma-70 factor (ECF subfamily)
MSIRPATRVDAQLVSRARRGDADAFHAIVEERCPTMLRTATAIIGDAAAARDATQEALTAMWRALPGLRDPRKFDAWATEILVSACRLQLRRGERLRARELPGGEPALPASRLRGGRASTRIEEAIGTTELLERAFERLEPEDRALLVLHHLNARPTAEVAAIMGIAEPLVRSRLHAARFALERALDRVRR